MPNGNGNRNRTVIITVMGTILALAAVTLIGIASAAYKKSVDASKDVVAHDGNAGAHPVILERIDGNQRVLKAELNNLNQKVDDVLTALEK